MSFEDLLILPDVHHERRAQRAVVRDRILLNMDEVLQRVKADECIRTSSIPMKNGRPGMGIKGHEGVHEEEGCIINIRRYPTLGRASIWLTRPDQLPVSRPLGISCDFGVADGRQGDSYAALLVELDQKKEVPARLFGITACSSLMSLIHDPAPGDSRNYPAESFAAACISACNKESNMLRPGSCDLPDSQSLLIAH